MHRRSISLRGVVQGVGFRPFVFDLATQFGLHGFVRNQTGEVLIEVEGDAPSLDRFLEELTSRPPPLARIDEVRCRPQPPRGERRFRIESSDPRVAGPVFLSPDVAPCDDCLRELFDPKDRRYRYPFLNCTNCGPRLTIIEGAPYDRERTTMADFAMCRACRLEYENPRHRRFHAQPTACPRCGPTLSVRDALGNPVAVDDPLAFAVEALTKGAIVAVKGLGGYHLACLASDGRAVSELRRRKHRDEKPLAIMVADLEAARALGDVDPAEEAWLTSPRRPIVLLRRRPGAAIAEEIAPRNPNIGVMLPYTPLHHLLLHDLNGAPLIMTSGNRSDEPIAFEDRDALERLANIADLFLTHDRRIHIRCDDSVTRVVGGSPLPIRRSRGEAPEPIPLPIACRRPLLALGGQLKVTFALGRGRHAILSHHIGDLDDFQAYRAYAEAIPHYERLFGIQPERIVHDLHPDYASTRHAEGLGSIPRLAVQHHHAHMASCMAEHGLNEPVIGVTFDGTGFGTDGTVWGGEFLVGDYRAFRRAAHLRPLRMPGGEQAIREPWRMALAYLADSGLEDSPLRGFVPAPALAMAHKMIERGLNAPLTSSAGRWFDALSALIGLRRQVRFEGQAAMELEGLASGVAPDGSYSFEVLDGLEGDPPRRVYQIDHRPMIAEVVQDLRQGLEAARIARRFHSTLVEMIAHVCDRLREETGLNAVALSGGVFLNALLTVEVTERLSNGGFRVFRHRRVPPGDGGLSLGQLAVAAAMDED